MKPCAETRVLWRKGRRFRVEAPFGCRRHREPRVRALALAMIKLTLSGHIDEVVATIEGNVRHI